MNEHRISGHNGKRIVLYYDEENAVATEIALALRPYFPFEKLDRCSRLGEWML